MSHMEFSKWLNNEYIPRNPERRMFIKLVSSKAVKQSLSHAETAYKRFFDKRLKSGYPKYKRNKHKGSFYLIGAIKAERHRIQLPTLKWVKLKEKGYIPSDNISSATVSREHGRFYVSVLIKDTAVMHKSKALQSEPIGIDLGLSDTLFTPKGVKIKDLRKELKIIKLEASLKRQQRKLSRRVKGSNNWYKQVNIISRLHKRISNFKQDIKRKMILDIVRLNPAYITIENLNIKGLMKNRRFANSFQQVGLGYIVEWLKQKCKEYDVELRQVDRFFPSSQLCSQCNHRQKMPLSKRIFNCESCGFKENRDINASINLKNASEYTVLV